MSILRLNFSSSSCYLLLFVIVYPCVYMARLASLKSDKSNWLTILRCEGVEKDMQGSGLPSLFSYTNLVHAVSGAVGSAVSLVVFYPLDTARTLLQVDDERKAKHTVSVILDIVKKEGYPALYRGVFPVVTSLFCSNFIYFYTYNGLKAAFLGDAIKPEPATDLSFAFIAGVVNVLVTTPLWVVNTRLKLQGAKFETARYQDDRKVKYKGILDALYKIARYEGVSALWNGTKASLVLASNPAIQFMVYEAVKRYFQRLFQQTELSGFMYFIIGAIAKAVATMITYPVQIIQSRLRAGYDKADQSQGIFQTMAGIVRSHGISGLYKGMETKLFQTVLTAALMFMVYEKIAATVFRLMGAEFVKVKI